MFYELTPQGIKLFVKVVPKASANEIRGISELQMLKVAVTAVPEDGKANRAVIQLLSKKFNVAKSQIKVLQGELSRTKTFLIMGDVHDILSKLEGL